MLIYNADSQGPSTADAGQICTRSGQEQSSLQKGGHWSVVHRRFVLDLNNATFVTACEFLGSLSLQLHFSYFVKELLSGPGTLDFQYL